MSTTGNEYQQPGVNYPDREDAGGATETPGPGEPTRDDAPTPPPAMGEPADDAMDAPSAAGESTPANASAGAAPAKPAIPEPSHEAVGIGVLDDGADHHGRDEGRDTLTAGEAQRTPGALGTEQEQRLPAMAQNNAPDVDKISGIVAQTRQDVGTEPLERIVEVLQQRLAQAGVELPEHDIEELARQVSVGDADGPQNPGRDSAP
jgi:hypothetical protein